MRLLVAGIDPGYTSGGFSLLEAGGQLRAVASIPGTTGDVSDRVDQAVDWFSRQLAAACPTILAVEAQHRAAFGASSRRDSGSNVAWVREVVGGIRRECFRLQIPVRLVEPQQWRLALRLPPNATKAEAWTRYVDLYRPVLPPRTSNHGRDAVLIAHAGSISAHLWLAEHKRKAVAA